MAEPVTDGGPSDQQRLLAANVSVALGTLLSRVTGLLRVIVFGIVIGQNALADAYDGANNSPNSIYELLIGGVLSATLVPLFTEQLEEDDEEATSAVVTVSVIAMAALTAAAVVAAPFIFRLFSLSPSASVDAEQYRRVGTSLARIFLIQIFFYGLMALGSSLLQARRRFFAPAWAPVLANVVIIGFLLTVPSVLNGRDPSLGLADSDAGFRLLLSLGATFGIAVMAVSLVPALIRAGVRLRFRPAWRHPAVRKLLTLSGWTLGYVLANQVALIVVKNLARPGSGGQDAYSKAFTFFQLPHGLLAVSITTTFVPDLARFVARKDKAAFIARSSLGVRLVALFSFPASLGMLALARPIIGAFLQHGEFSEQAAVNTGRALAGFSIGLVGFSVYLFVLRGFYAHQDTRTPFVINVGREPAQHRLRGAARRPLRRARAGARLRARLPPERGVGAPGPVVQGARLRAATHLRQPRADAAGLVADGRDRLVREPGRRRQQRGGRRGPGPGRHRGRRRGLRRRAGAPPVARARGGEAVRRP